MAVNISAAKLFTRAFSHRDFTGWPDFVTYDDGVKMSQLFLSVSHRRMVYSVIAKVSGPNNEAVFVLCMDQVAKGMESFHNKVGIMNTKLFEKEDEPRLVIEIDYGEHLVLDVVEQPAIRSLSEARAEARYTPSPQVAEEDKGEEEEDEPEEDEPEESEGLLSKLSSKASFRRDRDESIRKIRANTPPKGRMGINRHR